MRTWHTVLLVMLMSVVGTLAVTAVASQRLQISAAVRAADRAIPEGAKLVGTSKFSIPLKGDGFSTWIFLISESEWEDEFGHCPRHALTEEEIFSYGLTDFFAPKESVCIRVVEDTPQNTRVWVASKGLFIVHERFG